MHIYHVSKGLILCFLVSIVIGCANNKSTQKSSNSSAVDFSKTEGQLQVNGADLYYKIIGQGEPLIIVHGGPGLDHTYFLPQLRVLASEYQLIFFDQRLSGMSSSDVDTATIRLASFVDDIEGIRQGLQLDKIHLMAHSWGGLLGMQYAIRHGDQLKSLILLNSNSPSSTMQAEENQLIAARTTQEDSIARANIIQSEAFQQQQLSAYEDLFRLTFKNVFYDQTYADSLTLTLPNHFLQSSGQLRNLAKDLAQYDFFSELSQITCPTLIIYGDHEPAAQLSAEKMQQNIPNAQLEIIENCGHFPYIEAKEEFLSLIRAFQIEHGYNK